MYSLFVLIVIICLLNLNFALKPEEEDFDYLILVNKQYKLPDDYESIVNLVNATNNITGDDRIFQIEAKTFEYFVQLRQQLLSDYNITIELDSVYRSVARQQEIWDEFVEKYGINYTEKYVAKPGYSEHHTGLAVDICLVVNGTVIDDNDEMIKQKEIFEKIHKLLPDYGFILRYLEGKEKITGYSYEPWHLRFVEIDKAKNITARGITLEEYLDKAPEEGDNGNNGNILNYTLILSLLSIINLLL